MEIQVNNIDSLVSVFASVPNRFGNRNPNNCVKRKVWHVLIILFIIVFDDFIFF